ncbi:MAG: amino acid adenylation domain-containing protein [Blastocatellia bacterium]|nr:amino acid adenylation domain-containing protein [Blastocatellia bacterium]
MTTSPGDAEKETRLFDFTRLDVVYERSFLLGTEEVFVLPISFSQQRLWILEQLQTEASVYTIFSALRLQGRLHRVALEAALTQVIERHESLRTTFHTETGEAVQVIHPDFTFSLPVFNLETELEDLPAVQPARQNLMEAWVGQAARRESRHPFDLGQGPLFRVRLIQMAESEYVLLLALHHIISDGWSMGVFYREVSAFYQAHLSGHPAALPELTIQYADFAEWQRGWMQGEALETQLTYWRQKLHGPLPVLELPTDFPRPPVQTFHGAHFQFELTAGQTAELRQLAHTEQCTLFMVVLAVFKTLLVRYNRSADIIVGTPISGRNRVEVENLIGFFVNTLVLRTDAAGNPTFRKFLHQVRETALEAFTHQDLPFEKLVGEIHPERDLSRPPIFQVMFVFQNTPTATLELPEATCTRIPVETGVAKFDLTLIASEMDAGLTVRLEYNTDLFSPTTIERLAGHFLQLAQGIMAQPDTRLSELPLLLESERQHMLVEWNATTAEFAQDRCFHQLFEAWAEQSPYVIAASFETEQVTYRELNERANQLARLLQKIGIGQETLVGICLERSLEVLVAVLAVHKAGGAFVPLDPDYPTDRLAFMLSDSQVPVLITRDSLLEHLPYHQARLLCIDSDWNVVAREAKENLPPAATPDSAAYVIYTSGSTGKPKGVLIEHRGLVNVIAAQQKIFGVRSDWGVLQFASFSFDAAIFEIVMALAHGGTLCMARKETLLPGPALARLLREQAVTCITLTPSALAALPAGDFPDLSTLIVAGEVCPPELAALWAPGRKFFNAYGPTETTIWATVAQWTAGDTTSGIGQPIQNTQVFILDEYQNPVPLGVPGELYLAGTGLAREYLHRGDLTRERFPRLCLRMPQGFAMLRAYRTGDLARWLPTGNLQFLGRIDQQVKIRGFRIELGEIESVLAEQPQVEQAVVVARSNPMGEKNLVAYVVLKPETMQAGLDTLQQSKFEIQSALREKLPDFMVPATLVPLEFLPLTPNGKLDRTALPEPQAQHEVLRETYVAPRDTVEFELIRMWEELLAVEQISVKDNFFNLGGHSLLAVRLMTQIEAQFGEIVPLAALFQGATIEYLASLVRGQRTVSIAWSPLVAIQPLGTRPRFFCVHPVGGNVLCYLGLAKALGEEQPFFGLQALGLNSIQKPLTRIEDMAATYIQAIRAVQPQGPYHLGGWSLGGVIAFEMAQQLLRQGESITQLALFDSWAPKHGRQEIQDEAALVFAFAADLGGRFAKELTLPPELHAALDTETRLAQVLRAAKASNIMPPDADLQQMSGLFRVYKANIRAVQNYIPQSYPSHITLFRASERSFARPFDQSMGWSDLTNQPVEILDVPGDHYTILAEPNLEFFAKLLTEVLAGP